MWPAHAQLDPVTVADHSSWKGIKTGPIQVENLVKNMFNPVFVQCLSTFIWNLLIIGEAEVSPTVDSHLKTLLRKTAIKKNYTSILSLFV